MNIELKEIDKDTLKVGDWVGVGRKVSCGWNLSFRHQLITPAQITRITPKRTKFFTDKFETDTYGELKNESSITLVSLYPDLKSDELVKKQIDVYESNNKEIREMKEKKIDLKVLKWWLYFGK